MTLTEEPRFDTNGPSGDPDNLYRDFVRLDLAKADADFDSALHLVERLRAGGFVLLDTQMSTAHLARFGVVEVPRSVFERRLAVAMGTEADWHAVDRGEGE